MAGRKAIPPARPQGSPAPAERPRRPRPGAPPLPRGRPPGATRGLPADNERARTTDLPPAAVLARVAELRAAVAWHAHRYFNLDAPEISDESYDALVRELRALEEAYPALPAPPDDLPRVGGRPSGRFAPWQHNPPLLSLANAWRREDLEAWMRRVRQGLPAEMRPRFVCEPKIDGLAVALRYREGRFVGGATRGDGRTGEDVSDNLRTLAAIPSSLRERPGTRAPAWLEVRGEVYMEKSAFFACNRERERAGQPPFVTPRNAAAGSIRQSDPQVAASRPLRFCCFQLGACADPVPASHLDTLNWLRSLGFPTPEPLLAIGSEEELPNLLALWQVRRHEIDVPVDGFVLKVDARASWEALGATAREPRWAIAFKFASPRATTRLEDIELHVGRTGTIHPVARLAPVQLDDVSVRRASLHNEAWIRERDVRIGDLVEVERAGGVIPQVVGPIASLRGGEEKRFTLPERCPSCGDLLVHEADSPFARCDNAFCPAQRVRQLLHFVSREGMDIDGIGAVHARALCEHGWLRDPADLYDIPASRFAALPRVGPTLAAQWHRAIEESAARPLGHVIFALGIPGIGLEGARALARACGSLAGLCEQGAAELRRIPGIGDKSAAAIERFCESAPGKRMLATLMARGIGGGTGAARQQTHDEDGESKGPLSGEVFVFTGTLDAMTRAEASVAVESLGGRCTTHVSERTTRVVVGQAPGHKRAEALRRGIPTLEEPAFLALLERLRGRGR